MSTRTSTPERVHYPALLLLGLIGAISTTGANLSALSLVYATGALGLTPWMRTAAAGSISMTIAVTAVAAGLLADRIGRRRLLMASFYLAAFANLLLAVLPSAWAYLLGLTMAGLAYGAMATGSYAYVKRITPPSALGRALGLLGFFVTGLTLLGNVAGAALANSDWRLLFAPIPVMCLLALVVTPKLLPVMSPIRDGRVDWPGLLLLSVGVMVLIFGLTRLSDPVDPWLGGVAVLVSLGLFVSWLAVEYRSNHPLLPPTLLRSTTFIGAALVAILTSIMLSSAFLGLSDLLQYADRDSVSGAAVLVQPLLLVCSLGGVLAGRFLSAGRSPSSVAVAGALCSALGFAALAAVSARSPYLLILPGVLAAGLGLGATLTAKAQVFIVVAAGNRYGPITAIKTTFSQIGSALGMVISVIILTWRTDSDLRVPAVDAAQGMDTTTARSIVQAFIESGSPPTAPAARAVLRAAMGSLAQAFDGLMVGCAAIAVLTAIVAWRLLPRRPQLS